MGETRTKPAVRRPLTEREVEVLCLLAQGLSGTEVGQRLYLSRNTVRTHVKRMRAAVGARNVAHMVAIGYHTGVLRTPAVNR